MSSIQRLSQSIRSFLRAQESGTKSPAQSASAVNFNQDVFERPPMRTQAPQAPAQPSQTANPSGLQNLILQVLQLLKQLLGQGTPDAGAQPGSATPSVGSGSGPQAGNPATWTDNNAPYGVTLAGFSPQNHTDITPADLRSTDPATVSKNAKYLVYNYFLANQTQPTKDWAPGAADALNKQYGTNIFHAIDGETLGYGDEYVHSAPNGYGMPKGTYNPSATGELFWGSTSA